MKPKWEIKTLNQISENLDNKRVPITKNVRFSGEYPYYGASGVVDYVNNFIFDENLLLVSEDGANLLARTYPIAFSISGKSWVNNHAHVLRFQNMITQRYVEYYLNSIKLDDFVSGMAQPKLNQKMLNSIPVPYTTLEIQKKIVTVLDEMFTSIGTVKENIEKNIDNSKELFDSYLQNIFSRSESGWNEDKLVMLTTKIGSGATPRGGQESYKSEGVSLIRSMNVHDYGFNYRKLAFLDDAQAKELSNVEVQSRDVLLNITGASVARCCMVPDDVLPARVNQHVSIIRPMADRLDPKFLHYLLISKPYKDLLLETGEGGSTRQAITKAQIQDFRVAYPKNVKDQKAIVAKLDAFFIETQRLQAIYQHKLQSLEDLKKTVLQKAFSGELKGASL